MIVNSFVRLWSYIFSSPKNKTKNTKKITLYHKEMAPFHPKLNIAIGVVVE